MGLVQSTANSGTSKAVEYRMGSAIAIIATKTFSMSLSGCEYPQRPQRKCRQGNRRGAVPSVMQSCERVSQLITMRLACATVGGCRRLLATSKPAGGVDSAVAQGRTFW